MEETYIGQVVYDNDGNEVIVDYDGPLKEEHSLINPNESNSKSYQINSMLKADNKVKAYEVQINIMAVILEELILNVDEKKRTPNMLKGLAVIGGIRKILK